MRQLILLPCVVLLSAVAPAYAAPPPAVANEIAPSDAQQVVALSGRGAVPQARAEKKICKQLDTTGSRLPRRACLTEREWKQLQDELQK
jgi:hypothetical protein